MFLRILPFLPIALPALADRVLDAAGPSRPIAREREHSLGEAQEEDENCILAPEEFRAIDARITGGGFRDIGGGQLGAQMHGLMNVDAKNFIGVVHLLGRKGRLGQ